jgi:hypothetical protein
MQQMAACKRNDKLSLMQSLLKIMLHKTLTRYLRLTFRPLPLTTLFAIALLMQASATTYAQSTRADEVRIMPSKAPHQIDIFVGKQLFTSYIWTEGLKKPVLFPLKTASGTPVTRGFPLQPRPGERIDHPHHVGLWFNYGDVNGVDFWNNSTDLKPEQQAKMGTIRHTRVVRSKDGRKRGELEVEMEWLMPDGSIILRENTRFIFHAAPNFRAIDRITKLTALDRRVALKDNKEGVLGIRVARQLEHTSNGTVVLTDASGRPTEVPKMDNAGVTGMYRSSEGKTGESVWGTRGRWVSLTGTIEKEQVTLAILDHPANPGYPTYWHARGYGLFAANPLGQEALSNGKEKLNFTLEPKQAVTFRHRILIFSGDIKPEQLEREQKRFAGEVK